MSDSPDVLMGFCHNGSVATVFMNSLLSAFTIDASRPRRRLVEYHDSVGPYIHDNRCRIARYFLEHTDYKWLWMLDNDIEFPPNALYRLLDAAETHDVKILGGAYWNQYPGTMCALSWLIFTDQGIKAVEHLPQVNHPVEVTAVGMGCTLIHRDVLQAVTDEYGKTGDPWPTFGADVIDVGGSKERMGEDVTMCLRARQVGFKTYGLPSLVVEHHKAHKMSHGSGRSAQADVIVP